MLDAVAELAEHVCRDVLRRLRDEEHTDALGADQAHGLGDRVDVRRASLSSNSRCASSKKKTSLGLSRSLTSGSASEQLGQQPHQRGREELGARSCTAGSSRHEIRPAAVGRGAQEIGDLELRLAEELGAPTILEPDERAQQHADRRPTSRPPMPVSSAFPSSEERNVSSARRSGRSRIGSCFWSAERKIRSRLCSCVRSRRAPCRAAAGQSPRCPRSGYAGPDPAEREILERESRWGSKVMPRSVARLPAADPSSPGVGDAGDRSPFKSATNTGTPAAESCSAMSCSVFVLPVPVAPAMSPWRFIIAQRDLHVRVPARAAPLVHAAAEIDRRSGRGVRGRDRAREVVGHRASA